MKPQKMVFPRTVFRDHNDELKISTLKLEFLMRDLFKNARNEEELSFISRQLKSVMAFEYMEKLDNIKKDPS